MYERYCNLRDSYKEKDSDVVKATGIVASTFSDWKKGKSSPNVEKLFKIAKHFHVSIEYLITGKEEENEIDSLLKKIINCYNQLNSDGKAKLKEYAVDLVSSGRYIKDSEIGEEVSA